MTPAMNSTQLWLVTLPNDLMQRLNNQGTRLRWSNFAIGVFGFFGNMFVFGVICANRSRDPNVTENLLRHQAIVDFVSSLLVVTMTLFTSLIPLQPTLSSGQEIVCFVLVMNILVRISFSTSLYNLVALTLEQYFEVVHPLFHRAHLLNISTIKIICLEWTLCISICFIYIFFTIELTKGNCATSTFYTTSPQSVFVGLLTLTLNFLFPVMIMTYCLCRMAWTMHKKAVQVLSIGALPMFANAKVNIIKTLIMFLMVIFICWLSFYLVSFLSFIGIFEVAIFSSWIYQICQSFLYFSCSINPFIYAVKYKKFREGVSKLLRKIRIK